MPDTILKTIKKYWFVILIFIATLTFISYKYFFNPEKKSLNNVCCAVNAINSASLKDMKGSIINASPSISTLTDIQTKLITQKNTLDSLSISKNYLAQKQTLQLALSENIKICEQTIAILKNQNSNDLATSLTNLQTTYTMCSKHYSTCMNQGFDCGFNNNFAKFYKNACTYINEIIKIKRDNDITSSQNKTFFNTMSDYLSRFKPLTEDLNPAINRVKSDKRTLNVIINDVYEKESSLRDIKDSFATMSYPKDCASCYNLFSSTLDKYTDYISCLLDTLKKDIKTNSESYDTVNQKYSDMMQEYNKLNNAMNNFSK